MLNAIYRVTYVSQSDNPATVAVNDELFNLKVGMLIYQTQLINTHSSHVEIISSINQLYRLGKESEFCIENTAEGMIPVVFGKVYRKFYVVFLNLFLVENTEQVVGTVWKRRLF